VTPPRQVDRAPPNDRHQQRFDPASGNAQPPCALPKLSERFLNGVLRRGGITRNPHGQSKRPPLLLLIELAESGWVTFFEPSSDQWRTLASSSFEVFAWITVPAFSHCPSMLSGRLE
jgi:hypothetical protein